MKFKLYDVVIRKNLRYDKGCVVMETSSVITKDGGYNTKYLILDYDRRDVEGRNVKTWVSESEIEIFVSVMRDKKLTELGI